MDQTMALNATLAMQAALLANMYQVIALAHRPHEEAFMKDFEIAMRKSLTFRASIEKQWPGSPDPSAVLREAARQAELFLMDQRDGVRKAVAESARQSPAEGPPPSTPGA